MGEQYGLPDLRQFMAGGRTHFPAAIPVHPPPATEYPPQPQQHYYESSLMVGRHHHHHHEIIDHDQRPTHHHHHHHEVNVLMPSGFTPPPPAAVNFCGLMEMEAGNCTTTTTTSSTGGGGGAGGGGDIIGGNSSSSSRWPRQETLTLLDIRSRLDPKFKEANHKGPLWDEVSRIMLEEHGYQRSGKKCREKFENLYKYYKKTKEGKAGRQDGKHYRFFRQLEALYGETSNINIQASVSDTQYNITNCDLLYNPSNIAVDKLANLDHQHQPLHPDHKLCESLSFSNSSDHFETTSNSSENNEDDLSAIALMMDHSVEKKKSFKRRGWKAKIREFVESHMRKLMETQDVWMEKMLKTIEHNEQERLCREEEWRKMEAARIDREYKFWANERAWVEARDAALLEVLKKFTGRELQGLSAPELKIEESDRCREKNVEDGASDAPEDKSMDSTRWLEPEVSSLIQIRTSMEPRFQESGYLKEGLWEEISAKMACLGYDRSAIKCKEKWDNVNVFMNKSTTECSNKKRKENLRINSYFQQLDQSHNGHEINVEGLHRTDASGSAVQDSCFQILMEEGGHLWENYGVKFNKGKNQEP